MKAYLSTPRLRSGQALVIVVIFIVALFAFAAFSVDMGKLYLHKKILQNATDAAALASVMELPLAGATGTNNARTAAENFANTNRVPTAEITAVDFGHFTEGTGFVKDATPLDSSYVSATREVTLHFAPVIGLKSLPVAAHSVAQAFKSDSITGLAMPWVIDSFDPDNPPSPCQEVTLRFSSAPNGGAWTESPSNNSGNVYEERITGGYEGTISVGDTIYSLQGVKTGVNRQGTEYRIGLDPSSTCETVANGSERLVILPYVAPGTFGGGEGTWTSAQVLGFVVFFLERTEDNGKIVVGKYRNAFAGDTIGRQPPTPGTPSTVLLVE